MLRIPRRVQRSSYKLLLSTLNATADWEVCLLIDSGWSRPATLAHELPSMGVEC